jgi:hypothetical protein
MTVATKRPTLQRIGEIGKALLVPIVAFQLGRYSEVFSGSALAWTAVACYALSLSLIADSEGLRTGFRRKPDSVPMIADSR